MSRAECKGLVYRAIHNKYIHKEKLVSKVEMKLLKRDSCNNCDKCNWELEVLSEDIVENLESLIFPSEEGKYKLVTHCSEPCIECGCTDYEVKFVKVKEASAND